MAEDVLRFSTAAALDAAAVAALVNTAYRGDTSRRGWTTEADLLGGQRTDVELVDALIHTEGSRIELAWQGDRLVACVHLQRAADEIRVGMLSVHPECQGRGIGKAVLARVESLALAETDARRLTMAVITRRQELLAYYGRRGYLSSDRYSAFPQDPRYGVPRVGDLRLVWLEKRI